MKLKIKKRNVLLTLILLISFVASGCATDGRFRIFTTPIETRKAWSEGHPKLIKTIASPRASPQDLLRRGYRVC